jgi:hypothetical protein
MASSNNRVTKHRAELRARGPRPIQIWVPDTRSAAFAAEAKRQSQVIMASETDDEWTAIEDFFLDDSAEME